MSEWGIALIAAGSAILGSITTGWFAWKAGHRQAAAAEAAGRAQASALVSTVQATLDEQRRARASDQRRQVYARLLTEGAALESDFRLETTSMAEAFSLVRLEGPAKVTEAALAYREAVEQTRFRRTEASQERLRAARNTFIHAAQNAIRDA
ncbi:hypothetical protein ACFY9C_35240 [Streptomyces filamentosus]|uniref:hypothetical protein n=1 Tax=Streptomyces filamentosus TaxID=67294 RepID=UPI0036F0D418